MNSIDFLFGAFGIVGGFALGWIVFSTRLSTFAMHASGLKERLAETLNELEKNRSESTGFHERAVRAEAECDSLNARLKDQQAQLRMEFKNTSAMLLEEMSKKFSIHSEKQIDDLLRPMRDRLGEFQKLVVDSFSMQGKERHALKTEIEKIVLQADSLTKALRGDVKAQGNWGEIMLERILEESGLRAGKDYVLQGTDMQLGGAEGNRLKPDVIIRLPESKHIIVDSKLSLVAYERYCVEGSDEARQVHLKDFLKSVKAHVNALEGKRYQDIDTLGTPDFVLMFMPIEGAYSLAVQQDPELHGYAWGKKIVLVCPATLFATLRTIASLWRIEQQNRYAVQIADEGGKMYDKLVGFVQDMLDIGRQLGRTQQSYEQALTKLQTGTGNLIGRAEKMKQLGAKASKSLPDDVQTNDIPALREVAG